jgi:hypothetical protein
MASPSKTPNEDLGQCQQAQGLPEVDDRAAKQLGHKPIPQIHGTYHKAKSNADPDQGDH